MPVPTDHVAESSASSPLSGAPAAPSVLSAEAGAGLAARARILPLLFGLAAFWGAFLLFVVQPALAKMLLPQLGGTATVWTTCMVFFQAMLLLGYLYAHRLGRWAFTRPKEALAVHLAVLALPLATPLAAPLIGLGTASRLPALWLLVGLTSAAGAPVFVVATTAPLLQRWHARAGAGEPYLLYAASNAGSLLALLAYPTLIEPWLGLAAQTRWWNLGYFLFALLVGVCAGAALLAPAAPAEERAAAAPAASAPSRHLKLRWLFLAFVPVSLMLGTTQFLSTDVAAVPLLWVVPLAIYLATFILAFGSSRLLPPQLCARLLPALLVAAAILQGPTYPLAVMAAVHLLLLFVAAQLCHGRLAALRPHPVHLTTFYMMLALGGVLAGVWNAVFAPLLFDDVVEYPLAMLLAGAALFLARAPRVMNAAPPPAARSAWSSAYQLWPLLLIAAALWNLPSIRGLSSRLPYSVALLPLGLLILLLARRPARFLPALALLLFVGALAKRTHPSVLHLARSFFGVHLVRHDAETNTNLLVHGGIVHGSQSLLPEKRREPPSYYAREGPVGRLFAAYQARGGLRRVAVIGLGTGALASYGRTGDRMTFYELDPRIIDTARNPKFFTYLADSDAAIDVVEGDGRKMLERSRDGTYDLIVLDAFSSDAIPLHLLTREAVAGYLRKLAPGGVLLLHISNRYFELRPVVAAIAQALGLASRFGELTLPPHQPRTAGLVSSDWVALAPAAAALQPLDGLPGWGPLGSSHGTAVWTDNQTRVLAAFRWW